jgi:hypothetical protein
MVDLVGSGRLPDVDEARTTTMVGPIELIRVTYVDIAIAPDAVGLSAENIDAVPWSAPWWASDDGIRVGAGAWVAREGTEVIVVDPLLAADDIFHAPDAASAHQAAISASFAAAGVPIDSVTQVVLSHIEGIGMVAVRRPVVGGDEDTGQWVPFFPNARVRVSADALAHFRRDAPEHFSSDAWLQLVDGGHITTMSDGDEIAPGVRIEQTDAHDIGHVVIRFGELADGDRRRAQATHIGHLALSPLHLVTGPCPDRQHDADAAERVIRALADDGSLLLGGLWPTPSAGRLQGDVFVGLGTEADRAT